MARHFNGSSDRIDFALGLSLPVTIAAWFRTTATALGCIIDCDTGASGGRNYQFRTTAAGKLEAIFFSGGSPFTATGTTTINGGGWHHGAVVCPSSGVFTVYVDGVSDATSSSHSWATQAGTGTSIGSHHQGASQFFGGDIGDVAMWLGRALTVTDILGLAAGDPADLLNPTHYWPLWGVDSPEIDFGSG